MSAALELQKRAQKPLGEILLAHDVILKADLTAALCEQWGLAQLAAHHGRPADLHQHLDFCLKARCCPLKPRNGPGFLAVVNPAKLQEYQSELPPEWRELAPVICAGEDLNRLLEIGDTKGLTQRAEERTPKSLSCRSWARPLGRPLLVVSLILLAELIYMFPATAMWLLFGWTVLNLIAISFLRVLALGLRLKELLGLTPRPSPSADLDVLKPRPMVSILVPLHREESILPILIERLENTDYPRELLEFCLVVEQKDTETRAAIRKIAPGSLFRTLVVPDAKLKTKPRAMNYALDFCKGSIIGIYDAEDAPESDQISRIVRHFSRAPPDVACIQAYLDFYNPRQNWLSRCFTIEYAVWFRVVLHGVEMLKLPVPLGGTSVFFRRKALEDLGAWDAYNVTEDADLGMRLARFGYRCAFEPSTTFEEANCHPRAWVKQRSRWLKGYLMTWITHMRNPAALWRDLGPKGFLTFNVILLGTLSTFLTAPAIWSFWLISFGITPHFVTYLPWQAWTTLGAAFVGSECLLILLGLAATWSKSHRFLMPFVPTMMIYWPLGSLAAVKALYEVLLAPFYWDKTSHGHSNLTAVEKVPH